MAMDENDKARAGTLPLDPFEDTSPLGEDGNPEAPAKVLETRGVADIFAPLPPLAWRIEGLKIAPGAPAAICGYGYSGKSLFAQEIALCIASGKPVFGLFSVKRGRALHLDYEQGFRVTADRYQRLARAKGIDPSSLTDSLRLAVFPDSYLPGSADVLERTIDGFDFAIIDSLRASAPTLDENSSDVRQAIDPLARVSERTGATILFIHHGRKDTKENKGSGKQSMRGSSAIFDAFATVYMLSGEKGKPVKVTHEKCRHTGREIDDFRFEMTDAKDGGLTLTHLEKEQPATDAPANGTKAPALPAGRPDPYKDLG